MVLNPVMGPGSEYHKGSSDTKAVAGKRVKLEKPVNRRTLDYSFKSFILVKSSNAAWVPISSSPSLRYTIALMKPVLMDIETRLGTSPVSQAGNMAIAFQDEISRRRANPKADDAFRPVGDFGRNPLQQVASRTCPCAPSLVIYGKIGCSSRYTPWHDHYVSSEPRPLFRRYS